MSVLPCKPARWSPVATSKIGIFKCKEDLKSVEGKVVAASRHKQILNYRLQTFIKVLASWYVLTLVSGKFVEILTESISAVDRGDSERLDLVPICPLCHDWSMQNRK